MFYAGHLSAHANRRMMYRVKEELKKETNAAMMKNYYLLEPWAARFNHLNPQSTCIVEWTANHEFKRLFIMRGIRLIYVLNTHPQFGRSIGQSPPKTKDGFSL
jgi:hypothetical protein